MNIIEGKSQKLFAPFIDLAKRFSFMDAQNVYTGKMTENVFGFYSPCGGTGVTTLCANTAALLAKQNLNVAVLDFDMYYPSLFRLLQDEKQEISKSLADMFLTPSAHIQEYANPTKYDTLVLYSFMLEDDVYRLAEFNIDDIMTYIYEIAKIYDYVLIDIKGNLNQETTMAAISECYRIFTLVRPNSSDIERVYKDNLILQNYLFGPKLKNLLQVMVKDDEFSADDFKEYGFNLLENIPYAVAVEKVGINNGVFILDELGDDDASKLYREAVKHVAELILNVDL